jgi:hypothetical protein
MIALKSLRWRFRTWVNRWFWNQSVKKVTRPIASKIIVGLTTSPTRIKYLTPVLKSILGQSCPPDEIHLNIPTIFKRDGTTYIIPEEISKMDPKIKIIRTEDIGPGTKIIPSLLGLDTASDTLVITADDDILMLPRTIEVIAEAFGQNPEAIYGLSGYQLDQELKPLYYNKKINVEVLEGYAHFAVHRKFISSDFILYIKAAHSIREGFLHDDVILANYFALKKILRIQLFDHRANRKLLRKRGAQLYYGIESDALHKGGGDLVIVNTDQQTRQLREIAKFMETQKLWGLSCE